MSWVAFDRGLKIAMNNSLPLTLEQEANWKNGTNMAKI